MKLCIKKASSVLNMGGCARGAKGMCPEVLLRNY